MKRGVLTIFDGQRRRYGLARWDSRQVKAAISAAKDATNPNVQYQSAADTRTHVTLGGGDVVQWGVTGNPAVNSTVLDPQHSEVRTKNGPVRSVI